MGCAQSAEKAGGKEQPPAEKWDADSAKAFLPAQLLVPAEKQCTAVVRGLFNSYDPRKLEGTSWYSMFGICSFMPYRLAKRFLYIFHRKI